MPRSITPPLSAAAREYIAYRYAQNGSDGYRKGMRSLLNRFIVFHGDRPVGGVTPGDIERFFYSPGGLVETCQRTTLARYRSDLSAFFDWCLRRGYSRLSGPEITAGITERKTKPNRPRLRFTVDEIVRLAHGVRDPRDRALVMTVANTGLRISEALDLRIQHVSLQRGEIRAWSSKQNMEIVKPITSDLDSELRAWFSHYSTEAGGLKPAYWLFPSRIRLSPLEYKRGQTGRYNPVKPVRDPRLFRNLCAEAGLELEPGDGWHTIRRSAARIFFDRACNNQGRDEALRLTQAWLGHANAATTEIYLGLDREREKVWDQLHGQPFIGAGSLAAEGVVILKRPRA